MANQGREPNKPADGNTVISAPLEAVRVTCVTSRLPAVLLAQSVDGAEHTDLESPPSANVFDTRFCVVHKTK